MKPASFDLFTDPPPLPQKTWRVSLKHYGFYSRDSPVLADYTMTGYHIARNAYAVTEKGKDVLKTIMLSQYGHFFFSGTREEFDEFLDSISGMEDKFKVIGIREEQKTNP